MQEKRFETRGATARQRWENNSRADKYDEFLLFCAEQNITLAEPQKELAQKFFGSCQGTGRSTLLALLYGYDLSAQIYVEEKFEFGPNPLKLEARTCFQDMRSLSRTLVEKCSRYERLVPEAAQAPPRRM